MTNIEIWSDFACPFCYAGEAQLDRAIDNLGIADKVNVKYKAFELDHKKGDYASNPIEEVFMNKFGMSRGDAERQVRHEQQLVRDLGLVCNYEIARPSNTRDAHRLMKMAEAEYDEATVRRLNAALFDAYMVRSLSLGDHDVLLQAGRDAGIKEEDMKEVLQSDRYVDAVLDDERRAEAYGVTGVPYFVIDNKMAVPGAISTAEFQDLLSQLVEHHDVGAEKEIIHGVHPHRCTEDGCELL